MSTFSFWMIVLNFCLLGFITCTNSYELREHHRAIVDLRFTCEQPRDYRPSFPPLSNPELFAHRRTP